MSKGVDPVHLLASMVTAYRKVDWYQDSGYLLAIFDKGMGEEYTTRLDFRTHFCRPNLFHFEWKDSSVEKSPNLGYAIWSDGHHAYKKYGDRVLELVQSAPDNSVVIEDLELAIAGATGASSGAALDISSLLLPDFNCNRVTDLNEVRYVGDDLLDGELCHCVQGASPTDRQFKLWISATRHILLKMRQQYEVDSGPLNSDYKNVVWLFRKYHNQSLGIENVKDSSSESFAMRKVTVYQNVKLNMRFPLSIFARKID